MPATTQIQPDATETLEPVDEYLARLAEPADLAEGDDVTAAGTREVSREDAALDSAYLASRTVLDRAAEAAGRVAA